MSFYGDVIFDCVLLVHGAFADGSGWEAVAKILEKDGYRVSVAQPPETSYADDQKYTKAAIDAMGGPVVLVGHSYGGSIISEAGNDPNVAALVYIAAFALDEGDSCASIEQALPQASKAFKPDSNGNWWIDETHFAADFAADIPPAESHYMAISQVPISTDSFTHKVTSPAWKTKPTWYMVATATTFTSILPSRTRRRLAKRNTEHGSGLGRWRWVVERTFAWLNQFRRLRVRYEKRADIYEAFLSLGCALTCRRFLRVDWAAGVKK
jgi:pimeloyl-ACP methyl ester carboxylesterase